MTDDLFQAAIWTAVGLLGAAGFAMFNVVVKLQGDGIRPIAANSIKVWVAALVMLTTVALTIEGLPLLIPIEAVALLALSVLAATVFGDTFILMSQDRIGVSLSYPIVATHPIVTYIITMVFLKERFILLNSWE